MKYITTISDKDIFPNKGIIQVTDWTLRKTVKIIIQNNEGKIALVTNPIHNCFLLPGGGIEPEEDIFAAADRESREEALCSIVDPYIFGVIEEYRARDGKRYETYGIFAKAAKVITNDLRTESEKKNNLNVMWVTFREAEEQFSKQEVLLRESKIEFYNTGFNIIRDYILFKTAREQGLIKKLNPTLVSRSGL
jgi:ADP-ribose pyrophosphatase YjhB (NUDIX family)